MDLLLSLIPTFLRALVSAPASNSFLTPIIDEILSIAATLVEQGEAGASAFQGFTQEIQAMVASGGEPTADQWATLKARSDAAHAAIQGTGAS